MANQFDYQCGACGVIHTNQEWNDHTFEHILSTTGNGYPSRWENDENFFPLDEAVREREGAWFHCPSCDEIAHANDPMEVLPVYRKFKNNKDAKSLLEKRY